MLAANALGFAPAALLEDVEPLLDASLACSAAWVPVAAVLDVSVVRRIMGELPFGELTGGREGACEESGARDEAGAFGASGERAMIAATCSALRSSGLWSMSSKKRGVAEG